MFVSFGGFVEIVTSQTAKAFFWAYTCLRSRWLRGRTSWGAVATIIAALIGLIAASSMEMLPIGVGHSDKQKRFLHEHSRFVAHYPFLKDLAEKMLCRSLPPPLQSEIDLRVPIRNETIVPDHMVRGTAILRSYK